MSISRMNGPADCIAKGIEPLGPGPPTIQLAAVKRTHPIAMLGALLLGCVVAGAQAPPQGQAQPPAGRGRGAPAPATRIVSFEA